jgi:hypothetical protein
MDSEISSYFQKIVDEEFPNFVRVLKSCIDFEKWGFKKTFYGVATEFGPSLIYSSDSCRVRFVWRSGDIRDGGYPTMGVEYGRLHAADHHRRIMWDGKLSHCWHTHQLICCFLDGLSPEEATKKWFRILPVVQDLIESNRGSNWSAIEWNARETQVLWEYYGDRLFDLFDLQKPSLWEAYSLFVKNFYELDPSGYSVNAPPPDTIC